VVIFGKYVFLQWLWLSDESVPLNAVAALTGVLFRPCKPSFSHRPSTALVLSGLFNFLYVEVARICSTDGCII